MKFPAQDLFLPLQDAPSDADTPVWEYTFLQPDLPSRFSWAEEGRKPQVRSQGALETCWAISAVSAIESALLPGTSVLLSPDHMSLRNGFLTNQMDGGDYYMILSYLSDWKGPVTEAEDPYGDGVSPEGLDAALHVQEMRLLRGMSRQQIKQTILQYGAVQSSLAMDRRRTDSAQMHFYRSDTSAYRDPIVETLNHDILVLGWDDMFPREAFGIPPQRDGAWICLNTWGEDFGEDGIFYVSYEDANLLRKGGIAYTGIDVQKRYDRVYGNDTLGWQGHQGFHQSSCWMAGAFTSDCDQFLSAAGFYSTGPYTAYRLYLIPELREGKRPDTKARTLVAAGQVANPGYYTVALSQRVKLRAGQRYALCLWVDTCGALKPAAVEFARDRFTENVTLEGRCTWLSADGNAWQNTQERYGTNVCLKAYTEDME